MPRCVECQDKGLIGGQGFTSYICGECGIEAIWHNTNHPELCPKCMKKAQSEDRCVWCGKTIYPKNRALDKLFNKPLDISIEE